jgi:O-antigen/teichoic acid export membrane protein
VNQPRSRVIAGVAAHMYSQVVTIVTQLAALPIFLTRWNADQYGEWILLSAIPTYLSLADFGMVTAGANMMSMYRARGEMIELNRVFHSSILIIIVLVPLLALSSVTLLLVFDFGLTADQRTALAALLLSSLLNVACGLFDAAYRPFGKYPKVTLLLTTGRVVDWLGTIAGLFVAGNLTGAAFGMLCGRIIWCVVMFLCALKDVPQLEWKLDEIDYKVIRQLIRSGVGFLSFPISNMLTLQGMVLLVGAQLGGGAVALFNSSRTLARLLSQLAILTGKSTSPEISRLYGAGKSHEGDALIKQSLWIVVPLTIVGAVALELLGPWILSHWSRGKLVFDRTVFSWLVVGAVFAAYWQIRSTQLTATNRHGVLAIMFLIVASSALIAVYLTQNTFGISAAAAATCLVEVAMVLCTVVAIKQLRPPPAVHD